MILWLTGQSGSGKTTLAKALQKEWPCIILDGNEMRQSISLGDGFSRQDRADHNCRVARLAKVLSEQANVVVSVIAPMRIVRRMIDDICQPSWIYIKRTQPKREGHFYEKPTYYSLILNHDRLSIEQSLSLLKLWLNIKKKKKYSLFIGRWQSKDALHNGHLALFDKVRQEGKNILIGVRDTETDRDNPYTAQERVQMIKEQVPDAETVVIPDIEEVVFGRQVGYGIREIRLDEEIEKISATEIRRNNDRF